MFQCRTTADIYFVKLATEVQIAPYILFWIIILQNDINIQYYQLLLTDQGYIGISIYW